MNRSFNQSKSGVLVIVLLILSATVGFPEDSFTEEDILGTWFGQDIARIDSSDQSISISRGHGGNQTLVELTLEPDGTGYLLESLMFNHRTAIVWNGNNGDQILIGTSQENWVLTIIPTPLPNEIIAVFANARAPYGYLWLLTKVREVSDQRLFGETVSELATRYDSYFTIKELDERVSTALAQLTNQYQRRCDLIPNLVETVRGYAAHESETLQAVTEARSRAGGDNKGMYASLLDDPSVFARFQEAQAGLGSALQRLLVVTENYPDLQANQNFLALQDQLEGTENRIAVERQSYNEAAQAYNAHVSQLPPVVANLVDLRQKMYFDADGGDENAPAVNF